MSAERPASDGAAAHRPAIIIFGAAVRPDGQPSQTLRRRVAAAAEHGARLARPLYLPTGGIGRHGAAEAEVMAALLRQASIAAEDILPETTATDTFRSALACTRSFSDLPKRVVTNIVTSHH